MPKLTNYTWPFNLSAAITGNFNINSLRVDVQDLEATLRYIISSLPAEQQKFLLMKYKGYMTNAEIGKQVNITEDQVDDLDKIILHSLRSELNIELATVGLKAYIKKITTGANDEIPAYRTGYQAGYEDAMKRFKSITPVPIAGSETQNQDRKKLEDGLRNCGTIQNSLLSKNDSIELLNLSIRSINVLKRKNINTVQEFVEFYKRYKDELHSMRHVGRKGLQEISEAGELCLNEESLAE